MESPPEHELAYLLDFDGARYLFDEGYWVKIRVKRTTPNPQRPHGRAYSLTLHDPEGAATAGLRQRPWRAAARRSLQAEARGQRPLASNRDRRGPPV